MLTTIVFGVALAISVMALMSLINNWVSKIDHDSADAGLIIVAIIMWSWLFYLLH